MTRVHADMPEPWCHGVGVTWLWAARHRFLQDQLGLSVGDVEAGGKRPVVAFYGPSQVGKTGIILRLLGLREDAHPDAEEVLRGGRPTGKSATVTALRYGRANGDLWEVPSLTYDHQTRRYAVETIECSPDEAANAFERLRTFLTSPGHGAYVPQNPFWVGVPARLFDDDINPDEVPILIDLPGEGSSDVAEKHHVPSLIRKWLHGASTTIVTLSANELVKMTKLKFEDSDAHHGWLNWIGDLGLALTYALKLQSVKEALGPNADLAGFREFLRGGDRLAQQLAEGAPSEYQAHALRRVRDMPLFPMEFGKSLAELKKIDPVKYAIAQRVSASALTELRAHVRSRATSESALLATSGLRLAVQARHQAIVDACQRRVRELNHALHLVEQQRAELDGAIASDDAELGRLGKRLASLTGVAERLVETVQRALDKKCEELLRGKPDSPEAMSGLASNVGEALGRHAKAVVVNDDGDWASGALDSWWRSDEGLPNMKAGFSKHTFTSWYGLDSTRDEDWRRLCVNATTLSEVLVKRLRAKANSAQQRQIDSVNPESRAIRLERADRSAQRDKLAAQQALDTIAAAEAAAALDKAKAKMADALREAERNDPFLQPARSAFAAELERLNRVMFQHRVEGLGKRDAVDLARHDALVQRTCAVMKMAKLEHATK